MSPNLDYSFHWLANTLWILICSSLKAPTPSGYFGDKVSYYSQNAQHCTRHMVRAPSIEVIYYSSFSSFTFLASCPKTSTQGTTLSFTVIPQGTSLCLQGILQRVRFRCWLFPRSEVPLSSTLMQLLLRTGNFPSSPS